MEVLQRLKEKEFLFVTSEARNKFRSILASIEYWKNIGLASNRMESKEYRKAAQELFESVSDIKKSLISNESFKRPYIYTGLSDRLQALTNEITYNQPEAIFKMMNKFFVIMLVLKRLTEQLRD